MKETDELRPLTAQRLLTLWRESGREAEEPMERALLCNAAVLAESCFCQGEPVYANGEEVLELLTPREMEALLRRLADSGRTRAAGENPAFDWRRFEALREGTDELRI